MDRQAFLPEATNENGGVLTCVRINHRRGLPVKVFHTSIDRLLEHVVLHLPEKAIFRNLFTSTPKFDRQRPPPSKVVPYHKGAKKSILFCSQSLTTDKAPNTPERQPVTALALLSSASLPRPILFRASRLKNRCPKIFRRGPYFRMSIPTSLPAPDFATTARGAMPCVSTSPHHRRKTAPLG